MSVECSYKDSGSLCVCVCVDIHTLIIYFPDIVMKSLMVIKKCFVLTAMVNVCAHVSVCAHCV